ncbi:hypothetical protein ABG067_003116 [Albugo candida]
MKSLTKYMERGYLEPQERIDILQNCGIEIGVLEALCFDDDWSPENVDSVYQQELADIPLLEYDEAASSEDFENDSREELSHDSLDEWTHEVVSTSEKKSTHESTHELGNELENELNDRCRPDMRILARIPPHMKPPIDIWNPRVMIMAFVV